MIGTITIDRNVQKTSKCAQQQTSNITGTSEATTTNSSPTVNKTNTIWKQALTSDLADVGIVMEPICSKAGQDTTKSMDTSAKKTVPMKSHDLPPLNLATGKEISLKLLEIKKA